MLSTTGLLGLRGIFPALFPPSVTTVTWTPSSMFAGWASDGTDITIPIASLNTLTASAAAASNGDGRQCALSFCSSMFEWFNELTTAPEAMTATLRTQSFATSGDFSGKQPQEFKFVFYTDYPEGTVTSEPA